MAAGADRGGLDMPRDGRVPPVGANDDRGANRHDLAAEPDPRAGDASVVPADQIDERGAPNDLRSRGRGRIDQDPVEQISTGGKERRDAAPWLDRDSRGLVG